jgi:methionine-rich copper-binding protein CopC
MEVVQQMSRLVRLSAMVLLGLIFSTWSQITPVSAHAELQSAFPAIDGTVDALPATIILTFTEEVKTDGISVTVTGPNGTRVDTGSASVDLSNADRNVVVVPLYSGGPGEYLVHWETVSNLDGDQATGDFVFMVEVAGTAVIGEAAVASPTPNPDFNGNPLNPQGNFDSRALAVSIGAGLLVAVAIFGIWLVIRPKHPKFGSRVDRE